MARVDFYILPDSEATARRLFACRLAETAFQHGRRVYLYCQEPDGPRQLDELLWDFHPASFVPHCVEGAGDAPVMVGNSRPAGGDTLINLSSSVPPFYHQFQRTLEIVLQDEAGRRAGRANYRFYRDQGCDLHSHDMRRR